MNAAVIPASVRDRVISDTAAALGQRAPDGQQAPSPEQHRREVAQLLDLVLRCVAEGRTDPIVTLSRQLAADRFVAGADLAEAQGAFNLLDEMLWRHTASVLADGQRLEVLRLVSTALGTGKDTLAQTYLALASRDGEAPGQPVGQPSGPSPGQPPRAGARATRSQAAVVRTEVRGHVGVITLDDPQKRNAIGARLAAGVIAALASMQAQQVRAVVLRAAPGLSVWSAGHDISELPQGHRDPLGYNDHLEGLLRAIRTFPAPVIAMVHGTVWGGALDLVLSSDLVTADETASFAITAANLGLPYNTTGLLHFLGRLPMNLVKEMFFTAAPVDAQKAREWLLINHLVDSADLEAFTFDMAATIATKSPMAMAVIKEQLRVLSDYQPIAAQVYERIQGLRREAYDSSDYLEGLRAFAEKRPPVFHGS
jgi:methylmalonyl-CoA decarboxylase